MPKDLVCGMEVPTSGETFTVDGGNVGRPGNTFYFCTPMCRTTFLGDPEKFLAGTRVSMEAIEKRVMLYWLILLAAFGASLVLVFLIFPGR
jgi:YHS domain-containing protein